MAEYNLIQKYYINDNPNNYVWAMLPMNNVTPMMLYHENTGKHVDAIYMEENWFVSVQKLNSQKLPYAAFQKNINGIISVYFRWSYANVIMKWGDYADRKTTWNNISLLRTAERLGEVPFGSFIKINGITKFYNARELLQFRKKAA